jgi:hypothetical protein
MEFKPIHFIDEPIEVEFLFAPMIEKKPVCPDKFIWRGVEYPVIEMISEWHDYSRHGRMARNMQPQHASVAAKRGSWGVGIFYFRVKTMPNRYFDIFFDRSPKDVDDRKGKWFIYREIEPFEQNANV